MKNFNTLFTLLFCSLFSFSQPVYYHVEKDGNKMNIPYKNHEDSAAIEFGNRGEKTVKETITTSLNELYQKMYKRMIIDNGDFLITCQVFLHGELKDYRGPKVDSISAIKQISREIYRSDYFRQISNNNESKNMKLIIPNILSPLNNVWEWKWKDKDSKKLHDFSDHPIDNEVIIFFGDTEILHEINYGHDGNFLTIETIKKKVPRGSTIFYIILDSNHQKIKTGFIYVKY